MTTGSPKNIPASVHQRLYNAAKESGRPFQELLQYFAMERFLYRLSQSAYTDKFILKGAMMLQVYDRVSTRPTMDIDLEGIVENSIETITATVIEIARMGINPDDGMRYDTDGIRAERITEDAEYKGIRVRFSGSLGKATVPMQLDIGFGDAIVPEPISVELPVILDFPPPRLLGYPKETKVAEKFEAMVKLGELNSRMKDFYDIWLLSTTQEFDGEILARAVRETFRRRDTELEAEPPALSDDFGSDFDRARMWTAFITKSRLEGAPENFQSIVALLRAFLGPVAECLAEEKAFTGRWIPPGPWLGDRYIPH